MSHLETSMPQHTSFLWLLFFWFGQSKKTLFPSSHHTWQIFFLSKEDSLIFAASTSLASTEDLNWDFTLENCNSFLFIFWFHLFIGSLFFCWTLRFFTAVIFSFCNFNTLCRSILQEHFEICRVVKGEIGIGMAATATALSTSISSYWETDWAGVHVLLGITFGLPQRNFSWQMKSSLLNSFESDSFLNLFKVLSTTFWMAALLGKDDNGRVRGE